jgi:hypothetical protein
MWKMYLDKLMLFYSLVYASRGLRITEAGSRPTGLYEASTSKSNFVLHV